MTIDKDILLDSLMVIVNINDSKTRDMIKSILEYYNKLKSNILSSVFDHDPDDNIIFEEILINVIKEIMELHLVKNKNENELKMIYKKIKINDIFVTRPEWLEYIRDILISPIEKESDENKYLDHVYKRIINVVLWIRCNKNMKKFYGYLNNINVKDDPNKIKEIYDQLLNVSINFSKELRNTNKSEDLAIERIRLSSKEDILKAYELYSERNITGVIKSGLQGLNKMCGSKKGFGLGKSILFCALTHNFKSTMLLSIARWLREYNYFPIKEGKKPIVLFISLENEAHENMVLWFKHLFNGILKNKEEYKEILNSSENMDIKLEIISKYFNENDMEFEILRYLPGDFGFEELVDLINYYEENGYYVVSCIIDYLRKMKMIPNDEKGKYSQKGNHLLIMDLFNKTCNYLKSKGITLFTAHQLNRAAASLVNSGLSYPVRRFNESFLEGSIDVAREVDMIIYMHIEKNHKNESFLTLQWGKHRYEEDTPARDKFIAYKFNEHGIEDDLDKSFQGIKDIYSDGENSNKTNVEVQISY